MTPDAPNAGDHWLDWSTTGGLSLRLGLMPERSLFEPTSRTLFVADVHLGKAAVFRARGVPVPRGTTGETLARLSRAIDRSGAQRLVVLGDFLHARESHAAGTMSALRAWRAQHAALDCSVVVGNHDRHAGPVHRSLDIRPLSSAHEQPGLRGVHEPERNAHAAEAGHLTLAGHVHPVLRLGTRVDRLRLPCFWLRGAVLTLPAFGAFTGGYVIERRSAGTRALPQRFFVVGESVLPVD